MSVNPHGKFHRLAAGLKSSWVSNSVQCSLCFHVEAGFKFGAFPNYIFNETVEDLSTFKNDSSSNRF